MSTHRKDSSLEKISDDAHVLVGVFWGLFPQSEGEKKGSQCVIPVRRLTSQGDLLDLTQLQEKISPN